MAQPITPKQAREAADKERASREASIDRTGERYLGELNLAKEKYGKSNDERRAGEVNAKQYASKQKAIKANQDAASRKAAVEVDAQRKMIAKAYSNADDVDKGINRVKVKDVKQFPKTSLVQKIAPLNAKPIKTLPDKPMLKLMAYSPAKPMKETPKLAAQQKPPAKPAPKKGIDPKPKPKTLTKLVQKQINPTSKGKKK